MNRLKLVVQASVQGPPEEFSPATPVDCYRLAGRVVNLLDGKFADLDVDLFNRDDIGGTDDDYIALRNQLVAWGADIAVHIHQDAGGGGRGWHVIYLNEEAIPLANELINSLSKLPSPMRYGGKVPRAIAATRVPKCSVLVEAGFYTSTEDEAIGLGGWGSAIVEGISNYLVRHRGLTPGETEEDMAEFTTYAGREKDEKGRYMVVCDQGYLNHNLLINTWDAADIPVQVFVSMYAGFNGDKVFTSNGWAHGSSRGAQIDLAKEFPGLSGRFSVEVHSPAPVSAGWAR